MALNPLPSFLRASAQDAACSNMRKAGRVVWNEDDADLAAATLERLVRSLYGREGDNHPDMCFIRFQIAEQLERAGRFHFNSKMTHIARVIDELRDAA